MTVEQFYQKIGGDYEAIFNRMGRSEERILKFLRMMQRDESYKNLVAAVESEDYEAAFRAAHTMKGVYMNLELGRLMRSSIALTEALRGGVKPEMPALYEQVKEDYRYVMDAMKELVG